MCHNPLSELVIGRRSKFKVGGGGQPSVLHESGGGAQYKNLKSGGGPSPLSSAYASMCWFQTIYYTYEVWRHNSEV